MARQRVAAVVVADLDLANADETAALVREAGAGADAIEVNLRDRAQIEAMVAHATHSFDGLDMLFNNAGIIETSLTDECAIDTLPEDAWDAVYEVNLKAVWLTTKFAAPHLKRSPRGPAIINTASVSGSDLSTDHDNSLRVNESMTIETQTRLDPEEHAAAVVRVAHPLELARPVASTVPRIQRQHPPP